MREETRKRLDRLGLQSVAAWLPGVVAGGLIVGGFTVVHVGFREARPVVATVQQAAWRHNSDTGEHYPFIEARLDSGVSVRVGSALSELPEVGQRITVRTRAMLFDAMRIYEWDGAVPALRPTPAVVAPIPVSHP